MACGMTDSIGMFSLDMIGFADSPAHPAHGDDQNADEDCVGNDVISEC